MTKHEKNLKKNSVSHYKVFFADSEKCFADVRLHVYNFLKIWYITEFSFWPMHVLDVLDPMYTDEAKLTCIYDF